MNSIQSPRYSCLFYHSDVVGIEEKRWKLCQKCNILWDKAECLFHQALRCSCLGKKSKGDNLSKEACRLREKSRRLWQEGNAHLEAEAKRQRGYMD